MQTPIFHLFQLSHPSLVGDQMSIGGGGGGGSFEAIIRDQVPETYWGGVGGG